jgi:hypothetical protein
MTDISIINSIGNSTPITVNGQYAIKFSFNISDTVTSDDTITITFPTPSSLNLDINTVQGAFGITAASTKYNTTSGVLSIYMQNQTRVFFSNSQFILNVGNYTAPPTT